MKQIWVMQTMVEDGFIFLIGDSRETTFSKILPLHPFMNFQRSRTAKPLRAARVNPQLRKVNRMLSEHPPQINGYQIAHSQTLRYTVTAAVAQQTVTYQNILDSILLATTANIGFDVFDLVKIKSISIWGQAALGTPSSVSVAFFTATGDKMIHQDSSLGVKPAYVTAKPNVKSLASFWTASGGGAAFVLECPAGSIIDVQCAFRTSLSSPTQTQNNLNAVATVGEIYYRGLDGLNLASSNFQVPSGIQAI